MNDSHSTIFFSNMLLEAPRHPIREKRIFDSAFDANTSANTIVYKLRRNHRSSQPMRCNDLEFAYIGSRYQEEGTLCGQTLEVFDAFGPSFGPAAYLLLVCRLIWILYALRGFIFLHMSFAYATAVVEPRVGNLRAANLREKALHGPGRRTSDKRYTAKEP